jgi:hypothetical protein
VEAYLDQLIANNRVYYGSFRQSHSAGIMMALGNTVENCLEAKGQQQAWIGKISLPLFCRGLPDFG